MVSGSGNVAQYTMEKLLQLGAKPVTCSDSDGYIYDPDGIDREKLDYIMELKNVERGRIKEYAEKYGVNMLQVLSLGLRRQTSLSHQLLRTKSTRRQPRLSSPTALSQ